MQFAQPSQADAGDAVVVVEHVEDVVHAHQVGAGEDGGQPKDRVLNLVSGGSDSSSLSLKVSLS